MTRGATSRLVNDAEPGKAVVQELSLSVDFSSNREDTFEIHAHMDGTSAEFAYGVRECVETNPRGFHAMEGTRQFQDRVVRDTRRRLGWVYVAGLRRCDGRSQVLLDASCFCIRGTARHSHRGRCPSRTRSDCLPRRTQTQVTLGYRRGCPLYPNFCRRMRFLRAKDLT